MNSNYVAACIVTLPSDADGAIQLFPAGDFSVPHGAMMGDGPWQLDEASALALIARVARRNNPLAIDYEHQSLLSRSNGQPAPAAGWIAANALEWRFDGLYAVAPQWTPRAKEMIAAGEYRYLSPVFTYDPQTGIPTDLLNVALTNNPAIDGMQPVMLAAARFNPMEQKSMNPAVLDLLGLTDKASEAEIVAACAALKTRLADAVADKSEVAALKAAKPDPAAFAPISALAALQNELAALKSRELERDVDDLIEPALSDGRLLAAQEQWARDLGKTNLAALRTYLETAKPIAALRGSQTGGKPPEGQGAGALSDEQLAVCKALGISQDEFRKSLEA